MPTFNIRVRTSTSDTSKVKIVRKLTYDGSDINDAIAQAKLDQNYNLLATLKGLIWEENV